MNPSLAGKIEAARLGAISIDAARTFVEAWPAYRPGELREKAEALEKLAEIEVARLAARLRQRRPR